MGRWAERAVGRTPSYRRAAKRRLALAAACLVVLAGGLWWHETRSGSPVPKDIRGQVGFAIYYPDQSKLPKGYVLDTQSFREADPGVVLFSVRYGNSRSMAFSETVKPASDVIDKFYASAIPVHTQLTTSLGKAVIGAYGSGKDLRTIASLPINNGPWLIITAPSDINHDDLSRIVQSLSRQR